MNNYGTGLACPPMKGQYTYNFICNLMCLIAIICSTDVWALELYCYNYRVSYINLIHAKVAWNKLYSNECLTPVGDIKYSLKHHHNLVDILPQKKLCTYVRIFFSQSVDYLLKVNYMSLQSMCTWGSEVLCNRTKDKFFSLGVYFVFWYMKPACNFENNFCNSFSTLKHPLASKRPRVNSVKMWLNWRERNYFLWNNLSVHVVLWTNLEQEQPVYTMDICT